MTNLSEEQVERPTDPTEPPMTLTVEDTAKLLNLGLRQTYEAVRRGDIPAVKIGSRWLVKRADLSRMFGLT